MSIDLQQVMNSPSAIRFVSRLAHAILPRLGYALSDRIADWIASRRDSALTRAVRSNQWVAREANLNAAALDKAVHDTLP